MKRWHYTVDWTLTHHVARRAVRGWGRVTGRGGADLGRVLAIAGGAMIAWEGVIAVNDTVGGGNRAWGFVVAAVLFAFAPLLAAQTMRRSRRIADAPPGRRIVVFAAGCRLRAFDIAVAAGLALLNLVAWRWSTYAGGLFLLVLAEQCAFFTGGGTPIWRAALDRLRRTTRAAVPRPAGQPT